MNTHSHSHEASHTPKGRLDFTPYYFLNVFLPVFWFTYLGIAATYVFVSFWLSPALDDSLWVPIIYYSLSTAFLALTIACTVMAIMMQKYDMKRAEEIIKIPMMVAASVLILRFVLPLINAVQVMMIV